MLTHTAIDEDKVINKDRQNNSSNQLLRFTATRNFSYVLQACLAIRLPNQTSVLLALISLSVLGLGCTNVN